MFDFIRKPLLWEAWDAGHDKEIGGGGYHLKTAQDLAAYRYLRPLKGQTVAEIGGGESRLLKRLSAHNTCYNIEKFEGADGGPAEEIKIKGVNNIKAFLGEFSPEIPAASFDVVFSISVVEHVPTDVLPAFFEDGMRILKPGGMWLHAIDIYVEDGSNGPRDKRFEAYRSWMKHPNLVPLGQIYDGPLRFSTDMASNPDHTMHSWGKIAPSLNPLRQRAQSVSLLLAGRKEH